MKKPKLNIKDWIIGHRDYFIVFAAVFVLYNVMLAICGIYPYGGNTILYSDSIAQIGPFFEHIFRFLKGEASLFYYNGLAGGVEILSTIIYMLLNPFYLVLLPFGEGGIFYAFSLVLFLIFVFNAFVFLWFAKKYFKSIKEYIIILLTLIFTFSGYIAFSYGFVTWLIYPGITLLLIDAFLILVNEKKIAKFIATMVWFVVTSFGVGVSSNFILVLLFFGYIFFTKEKEEKKQLSLKLLLAYVVAALISIIILFPAIMAMLGSTRNASLLENLLSKGNYNLIQNKITGLFMETAIAVFAVFYLIKCNKKEKINKFYFFAIAVVCVPIIFDVSQKLLCGSIYFAFAFRFSFINTILLFILSMKYFELLSSKAVQEEDTKSQPLFKFLIVLILSVFVVGIIFLEIMMGKNIGSNIKNPNSQGEMNLLLICLTVLFVFTVLLTKLGAWRKVISKKIYKASTICTLAICLLFNFCAVALYSPDNGEKFVNNSKFVSSQNLSGNLKYFHLDKLNQLNTNAYGIDIYDYFSSLINEKTISSFDTIGFYSGDTFVSTTCGTILSDCLAGNNIYLSSKEQNRPYLKLLAKNEDVYVYQNTLATTGAVVLPEGFAFDNDKGSFSNFQALAEAFGITGQIFSNTNVDSKRIEFDDKRDYFLEKIKYTAEFDCILQVNGEIQSVKLDKKTEKEIVGECEYFGLNNIDKLSCSDVIYLNAGETVEFFVCIEKKDANKNINFTVTDYSVAKALCEKLIENQARFTKNKNGYNINAKLENDGRLFVCQVDIDGMNYKLDGNEVVAVDAIGEFACFDLSAGEHNIVATYTYPHITAWIIVALFCLLLVVLLLLLNRFVNLSKLNKVAYISMLVICGLDILVFYAIGIILSIVFIFL